MYVNEVQVVPSSRLQRATFLFVKLVMSFRWTARLWKALPLLMKVPSPVKVHLCDTGGPAVINLLLPVVQKC